MPRASVTQVFGLRRELGDRVVCTADRRKGECGHPVLIDSHVVCSHSGCKAKFSVTDLLKASLSRIADVVELQQVIDQLKSRVVNELISAAAAGSQPDPWIEDRSDWIWSRQAVPVLVPDWDKWAYAFFMGSRYRDSVEEDRLRLARELDVDQQRVRLADSPDPLGLACYACMVVSELGLSFSSGHLRNVYPQWVMQDQLWIIRKEPAGNYQFIRPEHDDGGYLTLFVT